MKLGVVTNGGQDRQRKKLDAMGLSDTMDVILISGAEGIRKPDRRIFHRALSRLGVEPREALFVGDHPEADIEGALGAGLDAVWKKVPYWSLSEEVEVPRIDRLSEILGICFPGARPQRPAD